MARSEAFGIPTAAYVPLRRSNYVIEVIAKLALQMRVAARSAGFISQGARALGPHRLHQRSDAYDLHDAFEVVGQYMQAHLGTDTR